MDYLDIADRLDEREDAGEIRLVLDSQAYGAYAVMEGFDPDDFESWCDDAEDRYVGMFRDDEDFAETFYNDVYNLDDDPAGLYSYIDWERVAHDLMFDYSEAEGYYFHD